MSKTMMFRLAFIPWVPILWALTLCLLTGTVQAQSGQDAALIAAAEKGDAATVTRLLNEGASVKTRDRDGVTPLRHARGRGQQAIVQLLEKAGAK